MLKVLAVVEKDGTAIDRLARGHIPYNQNIEYSVVAVHPKRPDQEQMDAFQRLAMTADIIDWQYYRTAEMLRENFPWLHGTKQMLTHYNPYAIHEGNWHGYDLVVASNMTIHKALKEITPSKLEYVPICVDAEFWQFNPEYRYNRSVIMVANRIEGKKGILPVAIACGDIGAELILVGAVSDPNYMAEIMATGKVRYYEKVSDEKLRSLYYEAGVHVCNSQDNFESGTMPILESMLTGVPVFTRPVGHVPDLYNEKNMVLGYHDPEAVEEIAPALEKMFNDHEKLDSLRATAWDTAKTRNFERRAYTYQKLYRSLVSDAEPVSVIMPVSDFPDVTRRSLDAVASQDYGNIELIVADDGRQDSAALVEDFAKMVSFPVRYIRLSNNDNYNLAEGRNRAVIEATGDILVFCDQRIVMEPNAITELLSELKPGKWTYGSKGVKKDFVENFSAVYRSDLIRAGLFNERIDEYGGMSQEVRSRWRKQGYETVYVGTAKATPLRKSANRSRKKLSIMRMKNRLWKMGLE